MNQSPGGSAKVQTFPGAYFAIRAGAAAPLALQTHPRISGLTPVPSLTYRGSYPVSKLTPSTVAADRGAQGIHADLFAYSVYKVNDMNASARPMVAFSMAVSTESTWVAAPFSFMMNLPLAIEPDMIRNGTAFSATPVSASAECLKQCNQNLACTSWNFDRASQICTLQKGPAPNVFYKLGNDCGLRGTWSYDPVSLCMTLNRPGGGGSHGNMSICASVDGPSSSSVSFGTYDHGSGAFIDLASVKAVLNNSTDKANGAILVSAVLPPSSNATLTITFGWFFPERDHFGKSLGNFYKRLFRNSADAAFGTLPPGLPRNHALAGVVTDILAMQSPFHQASLDPWLQDHLVNSLSHIRSAMWFDTCPNCHRSNDTRLQTMGFWRQWEAFDCPDIDSIHNDGERHLSYLMFWPDTTRNKLAAWAGNQAGTNWFPNTANGNGMLAEQIKNTNPDEPQGRAMADSSSMFICYILELLRWSGDRQSLSLYWPTVKRAAEWQLNVSSVYGVPLRLQTTYDILGFTKYELSAYASAFHILAMQAASTLALAVGDQAAETKFKLAADRGSAAMDELQWVTAPAWRVVANTNCPYNSRLLGRGFTALQCQANCTDGCASVCMSDDGSCYACSNDIFVANQSGFTLYTNLNAGSVPGSWAAASDNCTEKQGCQAQHGVFGDALYAQVLAYSAGLGALLPERKIRSHLAAELKTNCMHAEGETLVPGCDKAGMVIMTGRQTIGGTDWQIWEGAAPNHATLSIHTGEAPATALTNFHASATSWSERVNDQWNTAGIKDSDGYVSTL